MAKQISFNSLFIGIGSAIKRRIRLAWEVSGFQFPFHRDRLCNATSKRIGHWEPQAFQFPFHRDRLCNSMPSRIASSLVCFNSLFIGIGSAINEAIVLSKTFVKSFNSLFIGIGSAILRGSSGFLRQVHRFNSLFIGIGSAI
ncbi:hypothetical protein MCON_3405 [Methanothrix soehngenii GP6]|uniref:Uncharacterized protein n=1 Tax=Methanothrix soehngenii (strain ATCC 5969 / DSM 3671 / JCM 10134 / NBRC 103675 / OCM 69 / GP-6) TaxID=990316 RepID=F4BVN0_METSG|nr:hypothetical protein MCON_3405 [Methanothrix soehngenii GP6]